MPIDSRDDRVIVARLGDDPIYTADIDAVSRLSAASKPATIALDFGNVRYINSSNLAQLLRLRKTLIEEHGRIVLCALTPQVVSVFHSTALDKVFIITPDLESALKRLMP